MDIEYDGNTRFCRMTLQAVLKDTLETAGFTQELREGTKEMIFSREVAGGRRVVVYTGCDELKGARKVGKDAIRVCGVINWNGRERGVCKAKRVNRTGKIDAIAERMLVRMREVWKLVAAAKNYNCPSCGTPQFLSKGGNYVCADLCWTRKGS